MNTQQLKDKILQMAIQGKLVKQDPNNEPAIELLKRIKQEKEQLIKDKKIKKAKDLPPIEGDEKPFDIPESWEWVRLGEIVELISGRDLPVSVCNDKRIGIPYILGASNIVNGKFIAERWVENPQVIGRRGDLLISVKGTVGKMIILDDFDEINLSRQIMAIRKVGECVDFNYLSFFLTSYVKQIVEMAKGLIPGISREDILYVSLPLPPLEEQQRIVEKIDQLFTLIDTLEGNKEEMLTAIKETRNKVLDEAIRGNLVEQNPDDEPAKELLKRIKEEKEQLIKDKKIKKAKDLPPIEDDEKPFDIPASWEWVRLGEVFIQMRNGASIKQKNDADGIPITRIETISYGRIDRSRLGYADIYECGKYNGYALKEGDILMSHINSEKHLGKTAYYEKKHDDEVILHGMNLLCLRSSRECMDYKYLFYFLNTQFFKNSITDIVKRAVNQASINITNLSLKTMSLPPLEEQKRIVEKIDEIMTICDDLENQLLN